MSARLISNSIPNLLNGVSQQPDTVKLPNQATIQENGLSDIITGLGKRPPTEHIAKLNTDTLTNSKVHIINRDSNEQYAVLVNNQSIKVYDLAGNNKSVVTPDGLTYLTSTNPQQDFNLVTVADYTFIVNKTKTVAKSGSLSTARPDEAIFYVKNGQYKTTYEIDIDGSNVASFQTLDNSSSSNASSITTDNIATELTNDLNSNLSGYTIVRDGSIIYVKKNSGTFTAEVSDGLGGDGLILVKDKTNSFADLPYKGYTGFVVEIVGDGGTEFDNYFVQWDGTAWVETVKDGLDNSFDTSTMPHLLIRTADGNFRFCKADGSSYTVSATSYTEPEFASRTVGDETTSPDPTFVGRKINDIFFYRNRLGFLSDENVIFSKAGKFFTFWATTVTTAVDDDMIDLAVSHNKVSILKYAVPFNEQLVLFSDQSQFTLDAEEVLSAKTVSINQTTEYEIDDGVKPIGLGQNIYFGISRGSFAGVREYYVNADTEIKDALDTTVNLPRYISGGLNGLKGSSSENTLFAFASGERNSLFVYKYYFDAGTKALQRSWSKYKFVDTDVLLDGDCIQNYLYMVIKRADGTYLEKLNLKTNEVDTGLSFPVLLDRKTSLTGSYDSATNKTTFTLPYQETNSMDVVLGGSWSSTQKGRNIPISSTTSTTVVVDDDYSANPVLVGRKYTFKYQFPTFFVREQKATGNATSVNTGRLQLKKMSIIFGDTGFFEVNLTPLARTTSVYKFTGQILGSSTFTIGQPNLESGTFKFPIQCKNTDTVIFISSDSYLPCNFLSAEWEGVFSVLSQRIIT
jgi:hypothetical protein|tara:strand:+ start:854 stop:3247 length:2394 start_codon:yes stop_codon:yes gene_type:complete